MIFLVFNNNTSNNNKKTLMKIPDRSFNYLPIKDITYNKVIIIGDSRMEFLNDRGDSIKIPSNFDFNDIGIITPFLKQEKYLSKNLVDIGFNNVYTIDKSQGSEKEIIIISFVKTNFNNSIVNDLARINVAFTRAKNKLIIFGVRDVLMKFDNINKYIKQMEQMNVIYDLKEKKFS